jgi:DNA-3-methyladenine glycosylase I
MEASRRLLHSHYHDHHYGFPIHDDNELFGRLVMEINQAGLSWEIILRKETAFRRAYANFNIRKVAGYGEKHIARLLSDAGIVRNRLKVNAAIANAEAILRIQKQFGSFEGWLDQHHPSPLAEWTKLFRKTFKFTGGEIVSEFLMSTGYLAGAHDKACPVHKRVLRKNPPWAANRRIPLAPK